MACTTLLLWLLPYIIGALIFSRIVSVRIKEPEKRRTEAGREAERQRNLLISDIAHDIKTPVTTIAGLSISKKIIAMHGGKIMLCRYRSPEKYGKVKTFSISLPAAHVH